MGTQNSLRKEVNIKKNRELELQVLRNLNFDFL